MKRGYQERVEEVCRTQDIGGNELVAYAYRMWMNVDGVDQPDDNDPMFYQIKAKRDLGFFIRHIDKIAIEQERPLDTDRWITKDQQAEFDRLEQSVLEAKT